MYAYQIEFAFSFVVVDILVQLFETRGECTVVFRNMSSPKVDET